MNHWKTWFAFVFLGVLGWGTSFLWIKVALAEIGPMNMVMYRLIFGAATAWLLVQTVAKPFAMPKNAIAGAALLGIVNTAIPITMISWAEIYIDSGLTALLNSTMPLWTIVIAHFFLQDDRFSRAKISGLIAGFIGIIILISRDIGPHGLHGSLWGQLAVMFAAACYAGSTVFAARFLKGNHPIRLSAISLTSGTIAWLLLTPLVEGFTWPRLPMTWLALAWMGVIGLGLAYYAYFFLINSWGATRTSLVTYLIPVTAVSLGVIFLRERPTWHVFVGGVLVIGGIALVNLPKRTLTFSK